MTRRLLLSYLTVTAVVLLMLEIPLAVVYAQRELDRLTSAVERDATVIATIYEDDLEAGVPLDARPAATYRARTGARVVVVDRGGVARVDTDGSVPRDFSTRPEFATALTGRRSAGKRSSATLGSDFVYVAVPVASGGDVHGALRLTLDTSRVDSQVRRYWVGLLGIGALVLLVMSLVGWAIARSVTLPIRRLNLDAQRFAAGDLSVDPAGGGAADGPPEIRALSRTMSDMALRLDALIDEQRAFVADASHQLRTPLTALRLRLENLQTRLPDAEAAELEAAIEETGRMGTLVADLLHLARADQHQRAVPNDLARITADRVDTWSAMAELREVRLLLLGADVPVMVLAVPGAIEQIIDNVVDNALNATPAGGVVTLVVDAVAGMRRLTISDTGPGLSDEDKERAVRRFWRGAAASGGGVAGNGLGLAIASSLAIASGGSLRLQDAGEGGLSVVVELPPSAA